MAATLTAAGVADGHVSGSSSWTSGASASSTAPTAGATPTDVLVSDRRGGSAPGPRELGDVVICPRHTDDVVEAIVHGVLHLCGYDHETDDGRMLALQASILSALE